MVESRKPIIIHSIRNYIITTVPTYKEKNPKHDYLCFIKWSSYFTVIGTNIKIKYDITSPHPWRVRQKINWKNRLGSIKNHLDNSGNQVKLLSLSCDILFYLGKYFLVWHYEVHRKKSWSIWINYFFLRSVQIFTKTTFSNHIYISTHYRNFSLD